MQDIKPRDKVRVVRQNHCKFDTIGEVSRVDIMKAREGLRLFVLFDNKFKPTKDLCMVFDTEVEKV